MMDLQAIEARLEAATLGPWRRPEPKIYDSYVALEDCSCANGWDNGESRITLEESGLEDEDGNEYHRHTETDYHHVIGSNGHGVTGNYDWEAGGIMEEADTEFIAHAPEDIRALLAEVKAVRELHRKVPLYETPADECTEHDPDIYGIELDYAGEWYCSQHVAEWVCAECFTDDGEYVEYPCDTMRALGVTE